jgi:DNA topoisomerase-1
MLLTLKLADAVEVLKQPRVRGGRGAVVQPPLAMLGQSQVTGQPIQVKTGRFGAYVTDGQVNATIPSGKDPARLSLDDALELIAAREAKMREQGLDPRPTPKGQKKAAAAPAKNAAAKKAAATKKAPTATEDDDAPASKKAPTKKTEPKKAETKKAEPKKAEPKKSPAKKPTKKAPTAKAAKKVAAKKK